jgi:hypothetical protein
MWQEGNQAQGKPAQNKEHGERQIDFSCDNVQRSDDHQQKADQLDLGHIETKEDFPRVGKKCTLGVSYREEDVRRGKTLRERAARAPARLALVKLLPALDVEMTHPPALDAESMTGLMVLPGKRPAKISAAPPAFATRCSRDQPSHDEPENLSGEKRKDESHQDEERRKVRVHASTNLSDRVGHSSEPMTKGGGSRPDDLRSNLAEPGRTPFCPKHRAVSRCLASWEYYVDSSLIAQMAFGHEGNYPR